MRWGLNEDQDACGGAAHVRACVSGAEAAQDGLAGAIQTCSSITGAAKDCEVCLQARPAKGLDRETHAPSAEPLFHSGREAASTRRVDGGSSPLLPRKRGREIGNPTWEAARRRTCGGETGRVR